MPVYRLPREPVFPHPSEAVEDGLLAVGGDLSPARLLTAYASGIFPWYSEGRPILWYSPDPRFVLEMEALRLPRSLRKIIRRGDYEIRLDTAFPDVMRGCQRSPRPRQSGTWITRDMLRAYTELHRLGFAHSAEAWKDGQLVGGLYGVSLGGLFAGESMFALAPDASKVAFVWLVRQLQRWGYGLIDSQVHTEHLARFGAVEIPREEYLARLPALLRLRPGPPLAEGAAPGPWCFDPGFGPLNGEAPGEEGG
jgi:leucyl/phenylalanyl-tRNA--protein transferase